jgi:CheY-like chemotaxis protein
MLDQEELKWVASTSTELSAMLQQIARYADLARQNTTDYKYAETLSERVETSWMTAQSLFDGVTSRILGGNKPNLSPASDQSAKIEAAAAPLNFIPTRETKGTPEKESRPKASASEKRPIGPKAPPIPASIKVLNDKGSRELILIVEDEREVAELAGKVLTDEGYKVILARDGFEALKTYQQISAHVGLVILDYFLPVMDGYAVFEELLALNPRVAVVLSSGFNEQGKLNSMLARGLRGFIPKPYTAEKLLTQIRSTLDADRAGATCVA